jgi:hypothetical protein
MWYVAGGRWGRTECGRWYVVGGDERALPSPLGRGWTATALSPAVAGRVRGHFEREHGLPPFPTYHIPPTTYPRARRAF